MVARLVDSLRLWLLLVAVEVYLRAHPLLRRFRRSPDEGSVVASLGASREVRVRGYLCLFESGGADGDRRFCACAIGHPVLVSARSYRRAIRLMAKALDRYVDNPRPTTSMDEGMQPFFTERVAEAFMESWR